MKKKMIILFFLIFILLLSSCGKSSKNQELLEGNYLIYYVDSEGTGLVTEEYQPTATTRKEVVCELLEKLTLGFAKNKEQSEATTEKSTNSASLNSIARKNAENFSEFNKIKATVKEVSFTEEDRLLINFESDYYNEKGMKEVLYRACIVKTLSQVENVEFIEFNVNGQPLVDANEKLVGLMTKDDFIDDIEMETNYTITVYYANEDGSQLKESTNMVYDSGNVSMEQIVIKQLISGPTEDGFYETIPEGTTLLKVTTRDGICYVDFNQNFLNKVPGVSDKVILYSVVNTLVELPNVNKVQFLINGETKKTYGDGIVFDGFFERNLELIEGAK